MSLTLPHRRWLSPRAPTQQTRPVHDARQERGQSAAAGRMQSKRVLPARGRGDHPPPMAPLGPGSPLLSPTVREAGVTRVQSTLPRPARVACGAASSSSAPPASPEAIPCDVPLIGDLIKTGAVPLPNLVFCGWRKPDREWKTWVKIMAREDRFVKVWQAAGIEDAILNSTVNIRKAGSVMPALVGFWCASTSTFVLPWGEVGFTLEDAHVLGNLPVWGSPLQRLLTEEEKRLKLRLAEVWDNLTRTMRESGIRATTSYSFWLNWFLKLDGDDELLHLGFLAYWLSKFVIPSEPLHDMSSAAFEIAARLCRGERIALAPAVTANLYSDLTTITKLLYGCQGRKIKIEVWGLFRLLQAWLWERFDCLSPKKQNLIIQQSAVRVARWDNKESNLTYSEALEALYDPRSFHWRPYTNELCNWVKPKWYAREKQFIPVDEHSPMWVYDMLAIVSAAGLVGLVREDFIPTGQYKPYRVSMQLGYDQFIPTSTIPLVMPWDSSTVCPLGLELYVPSMTRKCSTIKEYSKWWEDFTVSYGTVLKATGCELKEQTSNKRKMDGANSEDNSGKMKKRGLSGDLKSEDCHQKREYNPGERHKISSGHAIIEVLDDEASDVIITKDKQGEEFKQKDVEHGLQSYEGGENKLDFDDVLVDELEEFLAQGLQDELLSSVGSPSSSGSESFSAHNHGNATYAAVAGQDVGGEIINKYPKFFTMIPQYPHYIGLLQSKIDVGTKKMVYTSLWYKLVELMQKAIRTTCQTKVSEIEELKKEACSLEKLGFDVRHLIARLNQPGKQLKRLELAKIAVEKARKRLEEAEKQSSLPNIRRTYVYLQKTVKEAEINVLEMEWVVEILGKCLSPIAGGVNGLNSL